jgi:CheY-like chemotaxis protein
MTLQALLVSKDDNSADILSRVLAGFGVAVERFSESEIALHRLAEQRFDSLIVDLPRNYCKASASQRRACW